MRSGAGAARVRGSDPPGSSRGRTAGGRGRGGRTLLVALLFCFTGTKSNPAGADALDGAAPQAKKGGKTATSGAPDAKSSSWAQLGYLPRFAFRKQGRWIQSSLRVESDGERVRVSKKAFGSGGTPWGQSIPSHLGGGFLFLQPVASEGRSTTALYRADTWTGTLVPVGTVPFVVGKAEFGFDRVYLLGTAIQIGFDLESRQVLGLDPIPPLVTLSGMRFLGSDRALINAPLVGVLYTNDAGRSWKPLSEAEDILESEEDGLFVKWGRDQAEVLAGGELQVLSRGRSEQVTRLQEVEAPTDETTPDERVRAVAQVVEQGARIGAAAVALLNHRIYEVKEDDGVVVRIESLIGKDFETCRGTSQTGSGDPPVALFACDGPRDRLSIVSVARSASPKGRSLSEKYETRQVLAPQRRRLLVADQGTLVVSGSCEGAAAGAVCLVAPGIQKTISVPSVSSNNVAYAVQRSNLVRVLLDQDKRKLHVERFGSGPVQRKSYVFSPDEAELLEWGALLPQGSVIDGEVAVWVVHRERFVGLRLGDSNYPAAGAIQRPLNRAIFAGRFAFVWGAAGFGKQSIDGGLHFTETELPFTSGDPHISAVIARRGAVRMGCSEVGCTLGRYVRFGWDPQFRLPAPQPQVIPLPPPGGGKLHFECGKGAFSSPPRLPSLVDEAPNFWEEPPPPAPEGHERFAVDFGEGYGLLYGFGPKDVPWGRQGRAQLYFVDPFEPDRVRRSAPTLRLFSSATKAQEELGILDRLTSASEIDFDPSGDGGVLLVRARDRAVVFSFSAGQPLVPHPSDPEIAWRGLSGAVLSGQEWYAGFVLGRQFVVTRLGALGMEMIADLPLGDASPRGANLVRTKAGDLGVAMEADAGLIVYPLSPTGDLGEPLLARHNSTRPPACPPEAQGFIVHREWSLMPYFAAPDESPLELHNLRARLLVGHGEPCLEAMSARTRSELPTLSLPPGPNAVPLGVLNHDSSRGRAQLMCE